MAKKNRMEEIENLKCEIAQETGISMDKPKKKKKDS